MPRMNNKHLLTNNIGIHSPLSGGNYGLDTRDRRHARNGARARNLRHARDGARARNLRHARDGARARDLWQAAR
jgi:hypothetical protein